MLLNNLLGSALAFSQEREERFFFFLSTAGKIICSSMPWSRGQTLTAWPPSTTSSPATSPVGLACTEGAAQAGVSIPGGGQATAGHGTQGHGLLNPGH